MAYVGRMIESRVNEGDVNAGCDRYLRGGCLRFDADLVRLGRFRGGIGFVVGLILRS